MIEANHKHMWALCKVANTTGQYVLTRSERLDNITATDTTDLEKRHRRGGLAFSGFFFVECYDFFKVWTDEKDENGEPKLGTEQQHALYLAAAFHDWKTHENLYTTLAPGDFKALGEFMAQQDPNFFGDSLFKMTSCGFAPGYAWFDDTVAIGDYGLPVKKEDSAKDGREQNGEEADHE